MQLESQDISSKSPLSRANQILQIDMKIKTILKPVINYVNTYQIESR
jgi:hypothetical protein